MTTTATRKKRRVAPDANVGRKKTIKRKRPPKEKPFQCAGCGAVVHYRECPETCPQCKADFVEYSGNGVSRSNTNMILATIRAQGPAKRTSGSLNGATRKKAKTKTKKATRVDQPHAARNGKKKPTAGSQTTGDVREIEVSKINVTDNVRKSFPKKAIDELADSIKAHGLLQPIVVREIADAPDRFELVIGGRRVKAVTKLKLKLVPARVLPYDTPDKVVKAIQVSENIQREDLNALDLCHAAQELVDAGHSQTEAGKILSCSQGEISNRLRILKLPESLRKRIASGDVALTIARNFCTLIDWPEVLEYITPMVSSHFDEPAHLISAAVNGWHPFHGTKKKLTAIRLIETDSWRENHTRFKLTNQRIQDLELCDIGKNHRRVRFTTNVELYDQLQAEAIERANKRSAGKKGDSESKPSKADLKEKARRQAEQLKSKVWRYRIGWSQARVLDRINEDDALDSDPAWKIVLYMTAIHNRETGQGVNVAADVITKSMEKRKNSLSLKSMLEADDASVEIAAVTLADSYFRRPPSDHGTYGAALFVEDLLAMERFLKINIAKEWKVDEDFLQTHTADQLRKLMKEWGMGAISPKDSRKDLINQCLGQDVINRLPAPKCLLTAKRP